MRIVFMGTPALAVPCLDALALDHEVVGVVTQPDKPGGRGKGLLAPPVKRRALEMDVPVLQPERARDAAFVAQVEALEPEAIAVVAYGQILGRELLDMAPRGCVNLHFSLLPRWRGAAPVQYALWHGDASTGVTTQWMAQKLDAGDIIQQLEVPIQAEETAGELLERLTPIGAELLRETFWLLSEAKAPRRPQEESGVTLAPQLTREDARLDWTKSAQQLANTTRAMNPWPGAWCSWRGETLKIHRARPLKDIEAIAPTPGQIVSLDHAGPIVACGQDALLLLEVQAPGKARLSGADWARGARLAPGDALIDTSTPTPSAPSSQ